MAVTFTRMPLRDQDRTNVAAAAEQAAAQGSTLLLTLEPTEGLATVTDEAIDDLVSTLQDANGNGVPVVVRFAHEMNGSWYAWGQQPTAYVKTFRRVATAVHEGAPGSSMMWAPSYGGGYPFLGGKHEAKAGSKNARALDTNGDGALDERDDSYAPYYPGDAAVDWVGMSLYHWGTKYPWGENEVPAAGKLVDQLRGRYHHAGVDERVVPDFYAEYGTTHDKPVAITETAALYAPGHGGAKETAVKQAWWRQAFAPELLTTLPAAEDGQLVRVGQVRARGQGEGRLDGDPETAAAQRFRCRPAGLGGHRLRRPGVRGAGHGLTGATPRAPLSDAALTQCG